MDMKKLINWLKDSHHGYHLAAMFGIALINLFLLHSLECSLIACFIGSLYTAAGISLTIEYIEKNSGGKFDYQDLIAGGAGFIIAVFIFLIWVG